LFRHHFIISIVVLATFMPFLSIIPQENAVNQRRIERERAKKQKQAQKDYKQAVKRHKSIQSKTTKAMMKHSRKQAGKITPIIR
jgi:uncharacterized membrane protein (DUF106 family)